MKNKKVLIIGIIIIAVLLVCGGVFAYVYFQTDLLKSNSQLFAQYGEEVTKQISDFFYDEQMESYYAKKLTNNYENSGTIRVTAESDSNLFLNADMSLTYEGAKDIKNDKFKQEISINYSNTDTFTFDFIKNDQIYALGSDEVVNKYIAIRNENLKEFASKLGITIADEIPEKIEINRSEINSEKIKELQNRYLQLLKGKLTESNFSKINGENRSYILTIEKDNLKDIILTCLKEAESDTYLLEILGESDEIDAYQESINNIIEEINETDFSNISLKVILIRNEKTESTEIKISLTTDNGTAETIINTEKNKTIKIQQNNTMQRQYSTGEYITDDGDNIEYNNMLITITKDKSAEKSQYVITSDTDNGSVTISIEVANISNDGATERYLIEYSDEDNQIRGEYKNAITFKDNVIITTLDDENSVTLNDYNSNDLNSLLQQLLEQIIAVNTEKIQNAYGLNFNY